MLSKPTVTNWNKNSKLLEGHVLYVIFSAHNVHDTTIVCVSCGTFPAFAIIILLFVLDCSAVVTAIMPCVHFLENTMGPQEHNKSCVLTLEHQFLFCIANYWAILPSNQLNLLFQPKTNPTYDITHKKNKIQNFPFFSNANLKTCHIFEGLNSSLAQSPGKLWSCKVERK